MNYSILRCFSSLSTTKGINVSILGASGRLGRLVALILKQSPRIGQLRLYDLPGSEPIGLDLHQIDTKCQIFETQDDNQLATLLNGSDIVLITAGKARTPNLSLGDMLRTNAKTIIELTYRVATFCPQAMIGIVTDPLHSIMPIAGTTLQYCNAFHPERLFGISSINTARASTIVAEALQLNSSSIKVPVVGGTFGDTLVPLLSKIIPKLNVEFTQEMLIYLTERIRKAPLNIVDANEGKMTGCISSAYAVAGFVHSLAGALLEEVTPVIYAMTHQDDIEDYMSYLVTPVRIGPHGIEKNYGIPSDLTIYEYEQLKRAKRKLAVQESFGIDVVIKLINDYHNKKLWPPLSAPKSIETLQVNQIKKTLFMAKNKDTHKSNETIEIFKEESNNKENNEKENLNNSKLEKEVTDPLTGQLFYEMAHKQEIDIRSIQSMMVKEIMLKSKIIDE